ncbi:MAG: RlmE family RNA methyltransferase [Pseudomonadales bacterium]|jgi:23S rRNA (uridine2552-2'-O)-methyltransferase|nr:RlmE family RNA methyltransferase [Pseudomonadales bacterium]MDP6469633.1 RlmE family RNA methyltransferase [Pseudomonadales bacterium]MDP6827474.1 RlmE family RNA methyltransferase [Pseudomonadales bacterium]MDP6973034.1 RlmE family RNA methyltransferase [Pseudomonadales bacterium]|tara:strand:- start:1935 stop:2570 length:636 start_codon:yes stop_codon:yes gene_type:complete
MPKRSKSSQRWLDRQRKDYFARSAREKGHGSRAHYKLEELDRRFRLLRGNMVVLELGAAPGGWTLYLEQKVAKVIAVDPLPVAAGAGTVVLEGRLGEAQLDKELVQLLKGLAADARKRPLDLVLSDMAPNISGIRTADQARSMELVEMTTEMAFEWLKPGATMLVKVFQGEGVDAWLAGVRKSFAKVSLVKPRASRSESREVYAVATGFRP